MAFLSLKQFLGDWLKKKNFDHFLVESQILATVNNYFKNNQQIALDDAKAISFKNGILVIKCSHSVIATELYLLQNELKEKLTREFPEIQVKKILFR